MLCSRVYYGSKCRMTSSIEDVTPNSLKETNVKHIVSYGRMYENRLYGATYSIQHTQRNETLRFIVLDDSRGL